MGKLVPQDPNDEPASELLRQIGKERAGQVAAGMFKKSKAPLQPGPTELPCALPSGWEWTSLACVAIINPRNTADDSAIASFVPMAMIGTTFDGGHLQEPRKWSDIKQGFTHFSEGDIGVAKITPCFENSKACVFSNLQSGIGAGTTELHVVRPFGLNLLPQYVLAYLKSPMFLSIGETKMTGTAGQKRLPKDFLENNPFPFPPLGEQRRIVAKVVELMALCDRLEAEQSDVESAHVRLVEALLSTLTQSTDADDLGSTWQRIAEHFDTLFTTESSIDELRQALVHLAVTGRLLTQEQGQFSANWAVEPLDDICSEIVDCPHSTPHWVPTGMVCVRTSQFRPGRLDLTHSRFVSESTFADRVSRLKPMENDILYSREGGILGVACRIPSGVELCLGQRMMLIRSGSKISSEFLELVLNSPPITQLAREKTTGGAAPRINVATVKAFPIQYPPQTDQRRIVAKVDELMALCDQMKTDLREARVQQSRLAETLIENALNLE